MSTDNSTTNSTTTSYPPFFEVTDDNNGPYAVVVAFCSIAFITSISAIRFLIAGRSNVRFELDDMTFAAAVVFGIANALCFYRAVVAGLGQHIDQLDPDDLTSYYKLMYTAQLLGILSQGAAKISVVMLFRRIAPAAKRTHYIFLGCISLWIIISSFLIAFQCQLPQPWVFIPLQCTTRGNVQYPVIIFNMITDIMLALGILPTVWGLNTSRDTRIAVILLFASRLIVVLLSIGLLVSVVMSITDVDQTWASLPRAAWDMSVVLLSIVTATIPRTNTFWASLQTGKASAGVTEYELSGSNSRSRSQNNTLNSNHLPGPSSSLTASRVTNSNSNNNNNNKTNISQVSTSENDEPGLGSKNAHLRLIPRTGNKVSTKIFAADSTSDETELVAGKAPVGGLEDDDRSQKSLRPGVASGSGLGGIYRNTEVSVVEEHVYQRQG